MQLNSQEHIDMIKQFEKDFDMFSFKSRRFDKEPREMWVKGHVYQDAEVNAVFKAWRFGYSYGRCVYMNS
jgi:hypothetical protein